MASRGCPGEGLDKRFLGFIVCPTQRLLSYKSKKEPRWLISRTKKLVKPFFDYAETLRRLGKKPPSMEYEAKDEVWYKEFVSFGLAWPPYIVLQGGQPGERWRFYLGWRKDPNWGGFIAPAAQFKRKKSSPLHNGY